MTPEGAAHILKELRGEETVAESRDLTALERRFVEEFFSGEHAQNGTRSWMVVSPQSTYATASVTASQLLKLPKAKRYLAELHRVATEAIAADLLPWVDLLPAAQAVILATVQGRLRSRLAFEAATYLTNRVLGMPTATVDVQVANRDRIANGTRAFTTRVLEEHSRRKRLAIGPGTSLKELSRRADDASCPTRSGVRSVEPPAGIPALGGSSGE